MNNLKPDTKKMTSKEKMKKKLESINTQMPYVSNGEVMCLLFPDSYRWTEEINGKKYICFDVGHALTGTLKFHESWWKAEYRG